MKRVLSFLSAMCLLIAFLPAAVTADAYENLTYSVINGQVTITDCDTAATGELVIPETIGGCPVTAIATSAFADCTGLTGITIGAKVTTIGAGAFSGCSSLAAITVAQENPVYHSAGNCLIETSSKILVAGCKNSVIPADGTVTAIGRLAFHKCTGLTAIDLPAAILSVEASAFEGCTALASVSLKEGVTAIGNSAFFGCTELAEVEIPDSVKTLGVYVFSGCTKLASVTIGDQISVIGNAAFSGCTALTEVVFGSTVTTIDVFAFSGCSKLAEVNIPGTVTTIGKFAFYNCEALADVSIPVSVAAIGNNAFSGCENVTLTISEENTYAIEYAKNNDIAYVAAGLGSLAVTTVTLRAGVAGVYFGSSLDWAASNPDVASYGIAVSTENPLPVADDSDASSLYTTGSTSVLIKDIMKTGNSKEENAANAKSAIYARVYVKLTSGEYLYSDAVQVTLRRVVIAVQNKWSDLTAVQQAAVAQMYTTYADVMSSWNVPNLK